MTSRRVVALGECMVELASLGGDQYRRGFAGDTYNFSWYLRHLLPAEWTVSYGTCTGVDAISDEMHAAIGSAGIDTSTIRRVPERTVGLYMIELRNGERSFSYWRDQAAARLLAADPDWLSAILLDARVVFFSGITLAVILPEHRATFLAVLAEARSRGTTIAFDPNVRPRLWSDPDTMREALMAAAGTADLVLPSFEDEQTHFGDASSAATLERYRRAGARTVIVKNGAGSLLAWDVEDGEATLDPPLTTPVDTTAAGDSFNGGFLAARLQGASLHSSLQHGAELAAAVIQHPGALVPAALAAVGAPGAGTGR